MILFFFCKSVELIEELNRATDLKFVHVEHIVSRNKTKDLSDISTNLVRKVTKYFGLSDLRVSIPLLCRLSIGAVTPKLSNLVLQPFDPLSLPRF